MGYKYSTIFKPNSSCIITSLSVSSDDNQNFSLAIGLSSNRSILMKWSKMDKSLTFADTALPKEDDHRIVMQSILSNNPFVILCSTVQGLIFTIDTSKHNFVTYSLPRVPDDFHNQSKILSLAKQLSLEETMVLSKSLRKIDLPLNCTPRCICVYPILIAMSGCISRKPDKVGFAIGCSLGVLVEVEQDEVSYTTVSNFGNSLFRIRYSEGIANFNQNENESNINQIRGELCVRQ